MRDALYSTFIKVLQSLCLALLFGSLDMDRNKNDFSEIDLSSIKNPSWMMRDAMALLKMFCTFVKVLQTILLGEFRKTNLVKPLNNL